jgi:hypothetical protein
LRLEPEYEGLREERIGLNGIAIRHKLVGTLLLLLRIGTGGGESSDDWVCKRKLQ